MAVLQSPVKEEFASLLEKVITNLTMVTILILLCHWKRRGN